MLTHTQLSQTRYPGFILTGLNPFLGNFKNKTKAIIWNFPIQVSITLKHQH